MRHGRFSASALATACLGIAGCGGSEPVTVPWLKARPAAPRALEIAYESDPCTRAREARLEEDADTVTVTLLDPERDPEQACIQLVKPGCVTVELEEPLGSRKVVDGAREGPGDADGGRLPPSRFGDCPPIPVERP